MSAATTSAAGRLTDAELKAQEKAARKAEKARQKRIAADEAANPEEQYFHDEMIPGFESIEEDQDFYINEAGNPVLIFEKYEIAPGYMGQPEFEVPMPG